MWQMSIGCSNNNYASREVCKKCGQSKEEAAMPAIAISGAHLPTYDHYFARMHGPLGMKMNYGISGNSPLQHLIPPNPSWSFGGPDKYGFQSWPLAGSSSNAFSYPGNANQLPDVPKGWRDGDWLCNCGFHNYSSRSEVLLYPHCCFSSFLIIVAAFSLYMVYLWYMVIVF